MRKQMIENAAYEVATQVRAVEESIEAALVELAELQTRMIAARGVMNAGFITTHAAFEQLAATTAGLIAARGGIAQCHSAMVEAKQFIPGLRTVAWGDGQECPEEPSGAATLRVVA
jgi:hypothetical protein